MLKYFKKQKSRRTARDSEIADYTPDNANEGKRNSLRSTSSFCDEVFEEVTVLEDDEASVSGSLSLGAASMGPFFADDEDTFRYHSRLSMPLKMIVADPNCLSYFVQYLDAKHVLPLIKFYLDTENFKSAAVSQQNKQTEDQLKEEQVDINSKGPITSEMTATNKHSNGKREQNNCVPELKTICDLSMRKPLTDDEKSRIYAETNKIIKSNNFKEKSFPECHDSVLVTETGMSESGCEKKISEASIKDAMTIYKKYLIAHAKEFVSLPVSILSQISLLLCSDFSDMNLLAITPYCFDEAQSHIFQQLEKNYWNDFLQSSFYCKYCIELIEPNSVSENATGKLNIYDILYSEVTLFFFMEFLEQHQERDCLDFWTAAVNFRKSFAVDANVKNVTETQADAMIIYEKFFSLQAVRPLWISDKLRCHVEERICDCDHVVFSFDLPLQITAKYLERKYFSAFVKSQLFKNFVNELKTKINEECTGTLPKDVEVPDANGIQKLGFRRANSLNTSLRNGKTISDCSSEISSSKDLFRNISQHNTLLAMDCTHLRNLHSTGTSLNIDSCQLTNPNLLWHRSTSTEGGLKFGRVSSLGRYERDFDAVDALNNMSKHNWSLSFGGNKIKSAVRKLVNLPEDRVQEEIAWQVAEMIVKDVTSVTLSKSDTLKQ